MRIHLEHPCAICGRIRGDHQAMTDKCPAGKPTRIGYVDYGLGVFVPLEGWSRDPRQFEI